MGVVQCNILTARQMARPIGNKSSPRAPVDLISTQTTAWDGSSLQAPALTSSTPLRPTPLRMQAYKVRPHLWWLAGCP